MSSNASFGVDVEELRLRGNNIMEYSLQLMEKISNLKGNVSSSLDPAWRGSSAMRFCETFTEYCQRVYFMADELRGSGEEIIRFANIYENFDEETAGGMSRLFN